MIYTLTSHHCGYRFSFNEMLYSLATGLSGIPYAQRHYELSKNCEPKCRLGHRCIAVLQATFVLGALAALAERIVVYIIAHRFKSVDLYPSLTAKMWKNTAKAISEQHGKAKDPSIYVTLEEGIHSSADLTKLENKGLTFSCHVAESKGKRPSMEDAHFSMEIEQGLVAGIFDGHNGRLVADYANQEFRNRFSTTLAAVQNNVRLAFESLINQIQTEIVERGKIDEKWNAMGSTALICFMNKKTRCIYTATLGDSQANLYRLINGQLKSIPLSCKRDWTSEKDAKRAEEALGEKGVAQFFQSRKNAKLIKYPYYKLNLGINVSRALGDVECIRALSKPGIIQKPKITIYRLQPKDVLILACDGLRDFVSEEEIIQLQLMAHTPDKLTNQLVKLSSKRQSKKNNDNVTVMVIEVK